MKLAHPGFVRPINKLADWVVKAPRKEEFPLELAISSWGTYVG